jgi:hypothetical protein
VIAINPKNFWFWFGGIWLCYGLPIGHISVQVVGQAEAVTIQEGKITDF